MKLLKDGVIQNISLKVVSSSSKTYKSFDLLDFDSETDGLPILSWSEILIFLACILPRTYIYFLQ